MAGGRRFVPDLPFALGQRPAPWAFGPVPRPRGTSRRRCPCSEPVPWGSPGGWRGLTGELVPPWGRLAPKGRTFRRKSSAPCPLLEGGGPPQRARDPKSPGGRGPSGPGQGGTSPEPFQRLPTGSFARPQGAQNQMPLHVLLSLLFGGICRGYVVAWKNAGEPQAYSGHGPVRPILFIGSRAEPWSLFRPFLASQKWAARTSGESGPG